MISIRQCILCKQEFDAEVGSADMYCEDCNNFASDFELYDQPRPKPATHKTILVYKEIDIAADLLQIINQIQVPNTKKEKIHNDFGNKLKSNKAQNKSKK